MGQKVHPIAWRLGYTAKWKSVGFSDAKSYAHDIRRDMLVRELVNKELKGMPVASVQLTHADGQCRVGISTSKPAIVAGTNNATLTALEAKLTKKFLGKFSVEVKEVKSPETNARLVADSICRQIERRMPYRRTIKKAIQTAMEKGAKGIKVTAHGRLNGVEIARREKYKEGSVPAQTIRANIDYDVDMAKTMYGAIGIKVWIYKGDVAV